MKHKILHIIPLLSLLGCNSDPIEVYSPDPEPILISTDKGHIFYYEPFSRAEGETDDVSDSKEAITPETVGLFGVMKDYMDEIFPNEIVYYKKGKAFTEEIGNTIKSQWPLNFRWPDDNDWVYAPLRYWSNGVDYQFYCYSPHSSIEETIVELTAKRFQAMTSFQISHIPPYSSYDYTVASTYKIQSKDEVPFTMKHISARICLRLKIDSKYSKMRKVKIKNITVKDRTEGGTYFQCNYSLEEKPEDCSMKVTANGAYNPTGSDPQIFIIPIFESKTGLELSSEKYQQYGSLYVMPQIITSLTVNVTYDVYDTISGEPVRKDAQVSNITTFPNKEIESGKYYNLNILVCPEYLYVLSDNDIKPDILISPEPEPEP